VSTRETITLSKKDLSGSKLRCLIVTSLPRNQIAGILSSLVSPVASVDERKHHWLPEGFSNPQEPKLGECESFLTSEIREELTSWWLVHRRGANTPNWDIVTSCTIEGKEGIVLVEAKAHDKELKHDGKSPGDRENHARIDTAITEANTALNGLCPGWSISRDSHYQLCNRFAWAWKVASLGVPVVLVYLGFLNAQEMSAVGRPFPSYADWRTSVMAHGDTLVPKAAWERRLQTTGAPLWAVVRSLDIQWVTAGPE